MPLVDGTLTDSEFLLVKTKLFELSKLNTEGYSKCPTCGSSDFYIHPALFGNRSDTLSALSPHTRLPTVAKYCKNCGHLTEYVARIFGINVITVEDR